MASCLLGAAGILSAQRKTRGLLTAGLILVEPPESDLRVRTVFRNRIFTCLSGDLVFVSPTPTGGLRFA